MSKYNMGTRAALAFKDKAGDRPVILVPGQVEGDASIRYGAPDIQSNSALLEAVRAAEPRAYIVYKPHPDVVAGNRGGTVPAAVLQRCADQVVRDADILDCLAAVDAVHTLTSLTGFEALLRRVPVTCYGLPFYAGWQLTTDRLTIPRRGRPLTLAALAYGALIAYPRYVDWQSRRPSTPEALVAELASTARPGRAGASVLLRLSRKIRFLFTALLR